MHTLHQFRLILSDAWGNPFPGMQVTLGHSAQGKQLNAWIGGERYTLLLQGHEDDYLIEGSLSEIWALKPKLAALPVEISIHPADMEERYFYAKKCRYLYKRIH